MTQLPQWGAPSGEGENEQQRGYPPQQYNQYGGPPYGQEQGQYHQGPAQHGYGPPHGASNSYYGGDNYNQGPGGYQQQYPQQQWYGGHAPQPYVPENQSSYASPPPQGVYNAPPGPPPSHGYGSPPPAPSYGNPDDQSRGYGQPYAPPDGPPPGHHGGSYPPQYGGPSSDQAFGPGGAMPPNEADRGLMGALAGGAAGGFAGHKMGHHGFIGALGGAYAGHKLEDYTKDERKKKKAEKKAQAAAMGVPYRRGSSSSSSSSSDDEKKKRKGAGQKTAKFRGNFSGSCNQISLDKDYDLIASCSSVGGGHKLSSISLNDIITNNDGHFEWVNHGGNFGGSARHVRLENGGKVLVAELGKIDGHWKEDAIWLDERITNDDGDLRFV